MAPNADPTAMVVCNVLHDGEAQTRAASRPRSRSVDSIEALKDPFLVSFLDAHPLIGDGDLDAALPAIREKFVLQHPPGNLEPNKQSRSR